MIRRLRCLIAFVAALIAAIACRRSRRQRPTIERVVSPGGIEAWLVREPSVPLIAVDFAFRGGANQDPADKPGVANMVAALLDEGAGELDAKAFQRAARGQRGRAALLASAATISAARCACCATARTRASTCCGWR